MQNQLSKEVFKDNKELALIAVAQSGHNLRHLNAGLKNDKDIVLTATKKTPTSIAYASIMCKNNKKIALRTLKLDGMCLIFFSAILQDNEEVVKTAIKQNPKSIEFASKRLQKLLKDKK
jgi:hypothetical protein